MAKQNSYEQYLEHRAQAHLFLAVIFLIMGGIGLWLTLDYFDQARTQMPKIMIDDANPALALGLLIALIPLGLELAYRKTGFLLSKKALIGLFVAIGALMVAAHGLGGMMLAGHLTAAGYEHCEPLDTHPHAASRSSRGRDAWVLTGQCAQMTRRR